MSFVVASSIYTEAAKRATSTIPIVFMGHADPVSTGHVTSLSRPGGNITGLSVMMTETSVKGLELFKQAVPRLARVAVIFDPATPSHGPALKERYGFMESSFYMDMVIKRRHPPQK